MTHSCGGSPPDDVVVVPSDELYSRPRSFLSQYLDSIASPYLYLDGSASADSPNSKTPLSSVMTSWAVAAVTAALRVPVPGTTGVDATVTVRVAISPSQRLVVYM